jgi:enoyl-CoA hydratase/carnithine racemase
VGYNEPMSDHRDVRVERQGPFATITMARPAQRNALSLSHLEELLDAFLSVGATDARGIVLAGEGPVFSAGHDFADLAGADHASVRRLLGTCTELMDTIQSVPQVVVARVHALATAAGCQLVATCDLAVAAASAGFAAPGGKGGWFCTTPMVAIGRTVARKHALELALTGDTIDAATAAAWGLVNRVVPDDQLDAAVHELLTRATRGSAASKATGKRAFYAQIGLDQPQAYAYAMEVMAAASQTPEAQEGIAAFLAKRAPEFPA